MPSNSHPTDTIADSGAETGSAVGDLLPRASVDSNWWYWIAAVPVYALVVSVVGVFFAFVAFAGVLLGIGFDAGALAMLPFVAVVFAFALVAVVGGLLTLVFPLAIYVDARAVTEAGYDWQPDPALYGLVALAGALTTTFVVTVPLALYYLYKRHEAVGTP